MAIDILSILAMSSEVERVFSATTNTYSLNNRGFGMSKVTVSTELIYAGGSKFDHEG